MKLSVILKYSLPYLLLFIIVIFLYRQLLPPHDKLSSQMVGEQIPIFQLKDLHQPEHYLTNIDLQNHLSLINVWASWCYACQQEQQTLIDIKNKYHIPIYGINYRDDPTKALAWLKKFGDPYQRIGIDEKGKLSIDLGIYGTPETFVIDRQGQIIYRHVGAITPQIWESIYSMVIKHAG